MSTRSVLVVVVAIATLLAFAGAYVLYRKHVTEEFVSDMQKCTMSDWLETYLAQYLSSPNVRSVGTLANMVVDVAMRQGVNDGLQIILSTRQMNETMQVLLRDVDVGRLIGLIRVCQRCLQTMLSKVPLFSMTNGVSPAYSEVLGAEWFRCVIEALRSSAWSVTIGDVYTMYAIVVRNIRTNASAFEDSDLAWLAYAEVLPRREFDTFVRQFYEGLSQVIRTNGRVTIQSVFLDVLSIDEEQWA